MTARRERMRHGKAGRPGPVRLGFGKYRGMVLAAVERSKGGRGKTGARLAQVYKENDLARRTGEMWQTMARVPEAQVRALEARRMESGAVSEVRDLLADLRAERARELR